ncbi:ribonuclease H-like domain-containing protein [Tanacetum coccineum]
MVLVAESGNSRRSSSTPHTKPWKPCFNFAKGTCRFGEGCRFVHDAKIKNATTHGVGAKGSTTEELLTKILGHLGMTTNLDSPSDNGSSSNRLSTAQNVTPNVFYASASPGPTYYPQAQLSNIGSHVSPPPGFNLPSPTPVQPQLVPAQQAITPVVPYFGYQSPMPAQQRLSAHPVTFPTAFSAQQTPFGPNTVPVGVMGSTAASGQATTLPAAFTVGTLHDPATSAWNMDTSASSYLNNSVNSLSTILNTCMYSTVSVGDGHSIPVTNTGHIILSTPLKSLRLNNVLITPHIVKNLIYVRQFVRDNDCTIEFDSFGFSVKDFITRRVLLRCDSTGDLYPVTAPSPIPSAFLCDHGGEFDNRKLHDLFNTNGIQFRFSCPQTSQQNGKSERMFLAGDALSRYKARLVANGSIQLEGVDVDETFSPVVKLGTIRTVLSLAVSRHWPVHQLDVKNAFLHGDLTETVYMHQPLGFQNSTHPDYVCLLQRSLYGLKQAHRAWFQRDEHDDIVLTASSSDLLQRIIRSLHQEFAMTDLGPLNYFLGVSVTRDSSSLFLSRKKYAIEILEKAHMVSCNPSRTPVDTESKLGVDGDPISDLTLYQSLADLVVYSDADWAGCLTTRRSTSGYCIFLGNNLLSWSAKRQPTLSQSSAEAEYRGVANAVAETCWLRNLLRELHTPLSSATLVYCDNVSAVYLSCNPVQHQCTKHIEIDIHFVRYLVAAGQCHMLIMLLIGSNVVKDGNESTPGDMIWYREIVPRLTLAVQTTDEVGSSSGSKLVASNSPAFEVLRRAYVNEIPYAITWNEQSAS